MAQTPDEILAVHDSPERLRALAAVLREAGYGVGPADDGQPPADPGLDGVALRLELDRLRRELAELREAGLSTSALHRAVDSQFRLDLALEAAGMGTWSARIGDGALRFDAAARNMLGRDLRTWPELTAGFAEADRPVLEQAWQEAVHGQGGFSGDGWWVAGGDRRRLRLRGRCRRDSGGSAILGVVWDITEDHRNRQRLMQSDKMESLGQLAGGVAHDFNNHLQVITGNLQLLRHSLPAEAGLIDRLSSIDHAAMGAAALVRQLLTFARRRDVVLKDMPLASAIEDLGAIIGSLVGHSCKVEMTAGDGGAIIRGCREQLQNAILNLCVNARDAMPGGGILRLSTSVLKVESEPCRVTGAIVSGRFGAIAVADSGGGIPEELQPRIFEPFFTTKPEGKGTGLGLPTVVGCVKTHEGRLLLHSAVGHGTTFTILLPLVGDEPGR